MNSDESLELLARAKSALEVRQKEIRERLVAAEGNPARLSSDDRLVFSSASRVVRAIGYLQFVVAVGATDDIPAAVTELETVCDLLLPAASSFTGG